MALRSPKLDDPRFLEKIVVPALPTLPRSARDLVGADFKNAFLTGLQGILGLAEMQGVDISQLIQRFRLGETPYKKFAETYPPEGYGDLASRQDPADIAELDAVVESLNVLFAERKVTNAAVRELLGRATAVFDKYKD